MDKDLLKEANTPKVNQPITNGLIALQKADLTKKYSVKFLPGPVGVELETDWYGKAKIVKSFKLLPNGDPSPAKKSGKVSLG